MLFAKDMKMNKNIGILYKIGDLICKIRKHHIINTLVHNIFQTKDKHKLRTETSFKRKSENNNISVFCVFELRFKEKLL